MCVRAKTQSEPMPVSVMCVKGVLKMHNEFCPLIEFSVQPNSILKDDAEAEFLVGCESFLLKFKHFLLDHEFPEFGVIKLLISLSLSLSLSAH